MMKGVSVILHLLDQMHGLRWSMQDLLAELRNAAPADEARGRARRLHEA